MTAIALPLPAPPTGDKNAIWRAVVEAATATLPEGPNQQVTARRIAEVAIARLEVAPARRWVGTIGDPCWICSRPHGEHLDGRCPEAVASLDVYLDATVDAARAGLAPKLALHGTAQLEAFLEWARRRGFAVTAERRTGRVLDVLHHWDFAEVELSGRGRITVFGDHERAVAP
jgi:GNAT superfamily N-acetyltransferase